MSSEISIEDAGRLPPTSRGAVTAGAPPKPEDGFRPWHFFVLTSILLATVAVILARQSAPEHLILISFTIAAAGAAAAALYRTLAPLTAPLVLRMGAPVSERTRAALEREKALVLRSIKELEFDRAMGKLSQKDFEEMGGRLRARALSLMKQLDVGAGAYTGVIEKELERRARWGRDRARHDVEAAAVEDHRAPESHDTGMRTLSCGCGIANDGDAVFCKGCGTRLRPAAGLA